MARSRKRGSRLRNYYILYFEIGLILALLILITAARVTFTPREDGFQVHLQSQEAVDMEEVAQTEQETEPPPPPKAPVPVEVPDNTVIEQEKVNFDATLDLSASLDTATGPPTSDRPEPTPEEDPSDEIFVAVEQEPDCGGISAVQKALNYPAFAQQAGLEGRVFVQFVVNEEGDVTDPTVTRGVHKLLDREALKAVKKLECTPGRQRGTPVKVQLTLPVTFELKDGRPPSEQ